MRRFLCFSVFLWSIFIICGADGSAQVSSTGSLAGTVVDPNGARIVGANVKVRNTATNEEFTTQTGKQGEFNVPALAPGMYVATITAPGFKQAIVTEIKVDVGEPSSIAVQMEIGSQNEKVEVVGGGELLQTQSANISTTIVGRQITDLPQTSRDALDLVLTLPGTATPGRPRTSTVNGLPKGALNITIDGINVQDNLLKSSDGFFTFVRPRIDAIGEVTVSTATPGAESAGEGAVQIKFVTQSGTNDFHGGGYWYHRNPALNANYFFNNRDLPPDPRTGKAPQQRILLNQYGGKLGGPIIIPHLFNGRDKAFFFVNYEEFRLPEATLRTRVVLNPTTQAGIYQYNTSSGLRTVNLYQLAAANGLPSTPDPIVQNLLNQIRSSLSSAGITQQSDPNLQNASFNNTGGQVRRFPTTKFDFNFSKNQHLDITYNYQKFDSVVDFLNGVDPAFPGFPNFGSQKSNRFELSTGLRSTLTSNIVNEARFGLTGGTTLFFPEVNTGQFTNQGGYNLDLFNSTGGTTGTSLTSATVTNNPQRRNAPVKQFTDTLSWIKGNHSMSFGGSFTRIDLFSQNVPQVVPTITFGIATNDPANNLFTSTNFPGASSAQLAQAAQFYAVLTGRVTSIGAAAYPDENGNFRTLGDIVQRARQKEFGVFGQDSWRVRPNLTLNYGLRWEVQFPFEARNNNFSQTTYAGLFGVSGVGNIFRPGVLTGSQTQFTQFGKGQKAYNTDYSNFAPSVGFAYSPNWEKGLLRSVFGSSGQTVLRGGFSLAYTREGVNVLLSILGSNPGGGNGIDASRSISLGNLPVGSLLRNGLTPQQISGTIQYPITGAITQSANGFLPNLKIGYAESFTVGIQRELTKDMVFEARYVGTRGHRLWRQYNINEVNTIENGFASEFALAQANLLANIAAGRGRNFRYFGPGTGTFPLPILLANFAGLPASQATNPANYSSSFFANTTFVNALNPLAPNVINFATILGNSAANNSLFRPNRDKAGLPANFFVVNPDLLGGAFLVDNGGQTWYDGLTLELRRRLSAGLLLEANYTFSKSLTNMYASSSVVFSNYQTLRDPHLAKINSPFDITHAFKTTFIYELPFGSGRKFFNTSSRLVDGFVGGWGINGSIRIQSGTPFSLGNVQLVGMTRKQLQDAVQIIKDPNKIVFFLPPDIIDNTIKAFNVGYDANNNPVYTRGAPTGRFIAPATYGNCLQAYIGQCGFANLVLKGPMFVRPDLSIIKKVRFTERINGELRAEFLNAFNNINFRIGNPANDVVTITNFSSSTFGQTSFAYQDLSTTNDPGGRLVQIVLRINF